MISAVGNRPEGSGIICETRALRGAVIPAKAGIYIASHWKCAADGLDSRLRGKDLCFEGDHIPNDAITDPRNQLREPAKGSKILIGIKSSAAASNRGEQGLFQKVAGNSPLG